MCGTPIRIGQNLRRIVPQPAHFEGKGTNLVVCDPSAMHRSILQIINRGLNVFPIQMNMPDHMVGVLRLPRNDSSSLMQERQHLRGGRRRLLPLHRATEILRCLHDTVQQLRHLRMIHHPHLSAL